MSKRETYIDVFKGICILLVIFHHIYGTNTWMGKVILSFHMACFFFISGYQNWNPTIRKTIKKASRLLIYQFLIGVLNVIWYWGICEIILKEEITQRWLAYFTTWYIPTYIGMLFVVSFISLLSRTKWLENNRSIVIMLSCCLFIAVVVNRLSGISDWDILHFQKVPLATFFFCLGRLCINNWHAIEKILKVVWIKNTILAILVVAMLIFNEKNEAVLWYIYSMGNMFFTIMSSFLGCMIILIISYSIFESKELEWLGRNTLIIYCMQFTVWQAVKRLVTASSAFEIQTINAISFILTLLCVVMLTAFINRCSTLRISKVYGGR